MTTELVVTAIARSRRQVATDLLSLTKPRVVVMVLVTTLVGYYVGVSGTPDYVRMLHLVVGTLLAAGGALAAGSAGLRRRHHAARSRLSGGVRQRARCPRHRRDRDPVPLCLHAAQAAHGAVHRRGRRSRRAAAGHRL